MVGCDMTERRLELIAQRERSESVRPRSVVIEPQWDLSDPSLSVPLRSPIAGPHQKPMKPRVEPVGIAESAEIAPRFDESLLDRVLGGFGVPEDQLRRGVKASDRRADERREGVAIALLRS